MKQLIFTFLTLVSFNILAQKNIVWFDTGLKVQYGASGLYSKAISDNADFNHELGLTTGLGFGGKIGINWEYNGLSLEGFSNRGKQVVENSKDPSNAISYEWQSTDIYALYRNAKNLGYFELGPKVSLLNKMEGSSGTLTQNIKDDFNNMNYAGVLGFGANIMGNDGRFSGILGLRFEYGFTDIVKSGNSTYPIPNAIQARTPTNPYFAGLVFELNWGIGYFGKAQCGARSKFIMF